MTPVGTVHRSALVAALRRMEAEGVSLAEMAAGSGGAPERSEELDHEQRIGAPKVTDRLRAVERVVLDGLEAGDTYSIIASRSGRQTQRIAAYARFKLDDGPLVVERRS